MSGYAPAYEPHLLLEEDVILVVPQFRLGPLGKWLGFSSNRKYQINNSRTHQILSMPDGSFLHLDQGLFVVIVRKVRYN